MDFNPLPHNPNINPLQDFANFKEPFQKTLWEKEKMVVPFSQCFLPSFSYNGFCPIKEILHHLRHTEDVCHLVKC